MQIFEDMFSTGNSQSNEPETRACLAFGGHGAKPHVIRAE